MHDIEFALQKSEAILYSDDAVIYYSDRNVNIIDRKLNDDFKQVGTWCNDNKLIINSNIAKAECVLFRINQSTAKAENFQINMNGCSIPEKYEYLGVVMEKNLNLTEHLEKMIKKASPRVKLLSKIRHNVNPYFLK